jgi:hypothetical protein
VLRFWGVLAGLRVAAIAVALLCAGCTALLIEKIEPDQQYFDGISYFLPKALVDLTIKRDNNGLSLVVGEMRLVPDSDHHYRVMIDHNPLYEDEFTVATEANGLLKSINSITTDKSPEIIKRIANAPIVVFGGATESLVVNVQAFDLKITIDPTSAADVERVRARLRGLDPKIQFDSRPHVRIPSDGSIVHPDCGRHICFRTAMPYALELSTSDPAATPRVISRSVVVVPNKHVVGQIPVTRAPFVRKEFKLDFTNGMLTQVYLKNPSEVLEFIQIPIAVAKSIVAIPSAMLKFQTTQITADNGLLTAQKENLDLQRQMIEAQRALLKAQTEAKNATADN